MDIYGKFYVYWNNLVYFLFKRFLISLEINVRSLMRIYVCILGVFLISSAKRWVVKIKGVI